MHQQVTQAQVPTYLTLLIVNYHLKIGLILFINVFGSWNGSFGVDTPSGNNLAALEQLANTGEVPVQQTQVFSFVPSSGNKVKLNNLTNQFKSSSDGQPQFTLASAQINNPASIKGAKTDGALLSATKKEQFNECS